MGWQFLGGGSSKRKRNQMLAVDLGSRSTKAVLLERRGDVFALTRYALLDAPIYERKFSPELLADHLRSVSEAMGGATKFVTLAIDSDSATVRQGEMPPMPADEMRQLLKINSKNFMQQDMPGCVFDCQSFLPRPAGPGAKVAELPKPGSVPKVKVLAAAAKQRLVEDYQAAAREAGMILDCITPGLFGPVNAFEMAEPREFANESVALVDIGFKRSTVCVLDCGELALSRVVALGGDRLTTGLAEMMGVTYAEAEGIKVGLAPKDEPAESRGAFEAQVNALQTQATPLGRELRASLDFFEHQHDRPVSRVYVSGGAARSQVILEILFAELMVECKTWNPTTFLQISLPGGQMVEIEHVGPQLDVAIGAALAAL